MTVSMNVVAAALSVARGLARLTDRVDNLRAESAALRADLALRDAALLLPPSAPSMVGSLLTHLRDTANAQPDPLGDERAALDALVRRADATEPELLAAMQAHLPDAITWTVSDPDGSFRQRLHAQRSAWNLDDADILRAAYYLEPGQDERQRSTPWRIAVAVIEVAAELALENADVLLHDAALRPVIEATLARFADPEGGLDATSGPGKLLRYVLRATLNGALDHTELLGERIDGGWVPGLLAVLANVRDQQGEDFVTGLVRGEGYPQLVASLLDRRVARLSDDDASAFEQLAGDVLRSAADTIGTQASFEGFLQAHWSGLLEGTLDAVQANGAVLLSDARPAARVTLLAAIDTLAGLDGRDVLQVSTLTAAVETAIGAVAADPVLLQDESKRSAWLNELLRSLADIAADAGLAQVLTPGGVQSLLQSTLGSLATHPTLAGREDRFISQALTHILSELAVAPTLGRDMLTQVAVDGVLGTMAQQPDLLGTDYPVLIGRLAASLADALQDGKLSREDSRALLVVAVERAAEQGSTLGGRHTDVVNASLQALLDALRLPQTRLLDSASLRRVAGAALDSVLARPDLFAGQPALLAAAAEAVVEQVLGRDLARPSLRSLAGAAVERVLVTFAARPELLAHGRHGPIIATAAGALGRAMEDFSLSLDEARAILDELMTLALETPWNFGDDDDSTLAQALSAFLRVLLAEHRDLISRDTVVDAVRAALAVVIADPELFRHRPQLLADGARAILAEVLVDTRRIPPFADLASAGVLALLEGVQEAPGLLDTRHPRIVATLAGGLAEALASRQLTGEQARSLLIALTFALREDVAVFADRESLASKLLARLLDRLVTGAEGELQFSGETLVELIEALMSAVAAHGLAILGADPLDTLLERFDMALEAALREAKPLLGRLLELREAAVLVAQVVRRWAQGGVHTFDNPEFARLVGEIAQELTQ
ncbi:MAG: hypothetical protein AAGA68_13360 [Pseudomonadota bacterium]